MVLTAGTIWWLNRPVTGGRTVSVDSTGKETETSYAYEYDNAGNRIRKKNSAAGTTTVTDYTYNSRNQLAEEETGGDPFAQGHPFVPLLQGGRIRWHLELFITLSDSWQQKGSL